MLDILLACAFVGGTSFYGGYWLGQKHMNELWERLRQEVKEEQYADSYDQVTNFERKWK